MRTKQSRGKIKRELILAAVAESLAQVGVESTTYDEISQRTGLRRSHIVFYFPNMTTLLSETIRMVLRAAVAHTEASVRSQKSARDKIFAVASGACDHLEKFPSHAAVFGIFYHYCTVNKEFKDIQQEAREAGLERLGLLLKELGETVKKTRENKAKHIRALITGFLLDSVTTSPLTKSAGALKQTRRDIELSIARILDS